MSLSGLYSLCWLSSTCLAEVGKQVAVKQGATALLSPLPGNPELTILPGFAVDAAGENPQWKAGPLKQTVTSKAPNPDK